MSKNNEPKLFQHLYQAGNFFLLRKKIVESLKGSSLDSHGKKKAQEILKSIEVDKITLLVGALSGLFVILIALLVRFRG